MSEPEQMQVDEIWRAFFQEGVHDFKRRRHLVRLMPSNPRCKQCLTPFGGVGGLVARTFMGKRPSNKNPNFCNFCEEFVRTHPGGAEVELTMLFADVRGSTTLAERMSASEFSRLLNRFYAVANSALIKTDAMIDKLVGDEVIGLYYPGFAGPEHARLAIDAAQDLLRATGHNQPDGPWLPVGVGIHTGVAFAGAVGTPDGHSDITVLGDNVNITARLASKAAQGEVLITDAAYTAAKLNLSGLEQRQLELKGKSEPIGVRVMRVAP